MNEKLENPATEMQAFGLVREVIEKINRRALSKISLIELSLYTAIENNENPTLIVKYLQDCIEDNFNMISDFLGDDLTNKVKGFC